MKLARICSPLVALCVVACTGPEPSSREAEKILWCTGCSVDPQPRLSGNWGIADFRRARGAVRGTVARAEAELSTEPLDLDTRAVRAVELRVLMSSSEVVELRLKTDTKGAAPVVLRAPVLRGEWAKIRFDPRLLPAFKGRLRRVRITTGRPGTRFEIAELRILG